MMNFPPASRPAIRNIIPYEPGKPISEVQREYGLSDVIKLASNENPLGPSPKALAAVRAALPEMHLYPDGGGYLLKSKLSEKLGLPRSQILLGNGSAELIELVTEAFVGEGDEVVICREEFFKYRIAVQIMNGTVVWAPMPGLKYDVEALLDRVTERTKVIFIANPNNPTGTLLDKTGAVKLMERVPSKVVVVFDEAYYEFRNPDIYPDMLEYVCAGRNVIVLRTLSKAYGLAGLRIGFAFSTEPLCLSMNAVREAFNVNSLAQVAAAAALDDEEFVRATLAVNEEGKRFFYAQLDRLGLGYLPTEANFVLIRLPLLGRELFHLLLQRGVVVRPVDGYNLPDYIRVSIGLPPQNERFFRELEDVLRGKGLL